MRSHKTIQKFLKNKCVILSCFFDVNISCGNMIVGENLLNNRQVHKEVFCLCPCS